MVAEVVGENGGQIGTEDGDAASGVDALCQGREPEGIERILETLEIFEIAKKGITHGSVGAITGARVLHSVERGGKGEGEFVEMMLKLAIAFEAEAVDDADNGGGIGVETFRESAHAEEDVFTGMLENGANDFLALGAELFDALGQINLRTWRGDGFRHGEIIYITNRATA